MESINGKSYSAFKRNSNFANSLIDLNRNKKIRKIFAVLLLAIFALSNTPTKYLHRLFANHKDFVSKTVTDSNTPQLNVSGINCHCETNVVIAPYTPITAFEVKPLVTSFMDHTFIAITKIYFSQIISFGLRGPPYVV